MAPHRRAFLKCNMPMVLNFIVLAYIYFTLSTIGDSAIRSKLLESLTAATTTTPTPTNNNPSPPLLKHGNNLFNYQQYQNHHRYGGGMTLEGKQNELKHLTNVYVWLLRGIHFPDPLHFTATVLAWFPDWFFCLTLSGLTLTSLYIAALSDPGFVPRHFSNSNNINLNSTPSSLQQTSSSGIGGDNSSSAADGGVAVTCSGAKSLKTPNYITMPPSNNPAASTAASYCNLCRHDRPPRAHHCRYCGQCIVRYDHHCDWIDNCVGKRNHKCFLLFIFYIFSCIVHYGLMFIRYFYSNMLAFENIGAGHIIHVVCLLFYSFIVLPLTILAIFFLFNTTWGILINETTYESMVSSGSSSRGADSGKGKKPQSMGVVKNIQSVLGANPVMWFVPQVMPLGLEVRLEAIVSV